MRAALHQRPFALLWVAGLVSLTGDWVLIAALPFYVYTRTGSTLATGGLLIALTLPWALLGPAAGVFVDRWDRRRTMIVADLARAALLLLLLAVRSRNTVWVVYVVAFLEQSISLFFEPARTALLPRLVGPDHLLAANALRSVSDAVARLAGPSLGGALLGILGLPGVAAADSGTYLGSGVLLLLIGGRAAPPDTASRPPDSSGSSRRGPWTRAWREWTDGLGLVRRDRLIAALFVVLGLAALLDSINSTLLVAFVTTVLHGDAQTFGWLLTAQGVGGLCAGVLIGRIGRRMSPARMLALSDLAIGALFLVLLNAPFLGLALALGALLGVPSVGAQVSSQTLLQGGVDDRYRGRIFGALGALSAALRVGGYITGGIASARLGVVPMLEVTYGCWLLTGLLAALLLPRDRPAAATASDDAPASDAGTNLLGT